MAYVVADYAWPIFVLANFGDLIAIIAVLEIVLICWVQPLETVSAFRPCAVAHAIVFIVLVAVIALLTFGHDTVVTARGLAIAVAAIAIGKVAIVTLFASRHDTIPTFGWCAIFVAAVITS
jgi:hypothetical protein